ncbi:MAG: tyrosine-type recombinase/integrase [Gordonibacter pamelaeae]
MDAVHALMEEYLSHLRVERGSSPLTVSAYTTDLRDYAAFLDGRGVGDADDVDRACVVGLRGRPRGPRLRHVERGQARVGDQGLPPLPRAGGLRAPQPHRYAAAAQAPERCPTCFRRARWTTCWLPARADGPPEMRNRAILEVLYGCGLRVSECTGLDLGDRILDEGYLRVVGKGARSA